MIPSLSSKQRNAVQLTTNDRCPRSGDHFAAAVAARQNATTTLWGAFVWVLRTETGRKLIPGMPTGTRAREQPSSRCLRGGRAPTCAPPVTTIGSRRHPGERIELHAHARVSDPKQPRNQPVSSDRSCDSWCWGAPPPRGRHLDAGAGLPQE
jgi:hypothetical protein